MLDSDYALKADERVTVIVKSIEKRPKKDPPPLEQTVREVAQGVVDLAEVTGGNGQPSSEGSETS